MDESEDAQRNAFFVVSKDGIVTRSFPMTAVVSSVSPANTIDDFCSSRQNMPFANSLNRYDQENRIKKTIPSVIKVISLLY